jgi:hypothetical protein
MADLIPPQWQDFSLYLVAPWQPIYGSSVSFLVDAWGRVQLTGEIFYPDGNPPDDSVMAMCPPGTAPLNGVSLSATEDVIPARSYRVDVGPDGSIRLRYPALNTTGQVFLDSLSWIAGTTSSP